MDQVEEGQVDNWRKAIGRMEERSERLGTEQLRRFALAVDSDPAIERVAPPLFHWAFLLPSPDDDSIGVDGHSRRGGFLPDIGLPRRMFAASSMEFHSPLELEVNARLVSRIVDVSHKRGRSGDLVFVEVERTIEQDGAVRVRERQSFVYRGEGEPAALPEPLPAPPVGELWMPGAVNLFRFSAATFNGHRIHYDLPYVVHGPFTATKLAALAMREGPLARFSFRAMAPLFLGQPIYLRAAGDCAVEAIRCDGAVAMRAEFVRA
jgi:3-methylfumaryl-CoA hydratase